MASEAQSGDLSRFLRPSADAHGEEELEGPKLKFPKLPQYMDPNVRNKVGKRA